MSPTKETIHSAVVNCLRNIYDPEIPVNIYDLGLIYNVDVDDDLNVKILMTMTAPDCPEAEYMFQEVRQMVSYISGVKNVDVELTFDPPWSMDMIPDNIKAEVNYVISSQNIRRNLNTFPRMVAALVWRILRPIRRYLLAIYRRIR